MALPWIRLDTSIFDHPKVLGLMEDRAHRAIVAHIAGMTYTGKHELDGFIPKVALRTFGATSGDATKLVEAGLWRPAPGGWEVNGWQEYQFTSEEARKRSERAREAANARWNK